MNKRWLALSLSAIITGFVFLFSSCKKINESTELGTGLLPAVDNITTFDTTLEVMAFNDTFDLLTDSLRFSSNNEAFLGLINNDPIFGKTDARLFLELKPSFYNFSFLNRPDSLFLDSVVLILDHANTYGDSTIPQTVNVYEVNQSSSFNPDSFYLVRQNDFNYSNLLGSRTFLPSILDDSVYAFMDTTNHQLRIKLDNSFGNRLLAFDSIGATGAYSSDSVFRTYFKGFAIQSMNSGNAIMGFNLSGVNTKLGIYYKYNNGGPTILDTTVTYFNFGSINSDISSNISASANYVIRNYSGTSLAASVGGASPDQFVYLQSTPGSYATIKIPDLSGLSNRVVQRAELIAEEVYDPSDAIFPPPERLFLDAYDTSLSKFRTIPYDFNYDLSSGVANFGSFGSDPVNAVDASGNTIKVWHFDISR
ncbi:MAG: DUF4270 family protein, partial [Bacteroidia bacterium]|nr:DUF4270 family protein [Bacteroidia bacterium]